MRLLRDFFSPFINTRPVLILALLFAGLHILLYLRLGIVITGEAEKYIEQGERLYLNQPFSEQKYFFYLPVILLVWLAKTLHIGLGWVVIVQILFSAFSQYCFYRLILDLTGKKNMAFIGSLLLLLFLPYQTWNLYLYSESIFLSLSILFVCSVYRAGYQISNRWILPLVLLAILIFTRPTGILLLFPWVVYQIWIQKGIRKRLLHLTAGLIFILLAFFSINILYAGGADFNSVLPYVEKHIICGVPTVQTVADPGSLKTGSAIGSLFSWIIQHPIDFFLLFLQRLISFFNLTRSYYSMEHNALLALYLLPIYFFSFPGWIKIRELTSTFSRFLLCVFIFYPFSIAMQCDDWHSRFTMPLIPCFVLLATLGMDRILWHQKKL